MLFRDIQGKLINIERKEFHNDKDYYEKICSVYNIKFPKQDNQFETIINYINKSKDLSYSHNRSK
jgi:uncharacterized protein YozE (UPF0346 family)|tara:strand:- start:2728 stop:2922 length:195 start_codon:yes stop_codon:yes gene_type:complete